RAPMATPTSAAASAGASFTPSPTMIVTPPSPSAFTASTLSAGSRSDRIRSTPIEIPTDSATSGWSPVTITTRLMPARRSVRITLGVSGRIGSSRSSAPAHVARPIRKRRPPSDPGGRPERHDPAVHLALDPRPVLLVDVARERERELATSGRPHDRGREHVGRDLVERRSQAQQLIGADVAEHLDVGDLRHPRGERSGLVEEQDRAPRDRLERAAPLDD